MIQSSFVENRSVSLRVLSADEIWEIKQAAFDVSEKTGCNVWRLAPRTWSSAYTIGCGRS